GRSRFGAQGPGAPPGLCHQRIPDRNVREGMEVAVGRPKLADPMEETQGSDPGVVHARPRYPCLVHDPPKHRPVTFDLGKKDEAWRAQPRAHPLTRDRQWWRRPPDPRMCDDGDELVDARPGNCR